MFSFFSPIIPSLSPLSSSRKSQNDETNANHRWPAQESAQQLCPYLLGSASRTHEPKRERKGKERKGKAAAVTLRRSRLYGYHGVERREHCGARSQPNKKKKRKETERERNAACKCMCICTSQSLALGVRRTNTDIKDHGQPEYENRRIGLWSRCKALAFASM